MARSLQVILEGEEVAADVSVADIAADTDGFSGSDLRQLCVTAAMRPVRELLAASGRSGNTHPSQTATPPRRHPAKQPEAAPPFGTGDAPAAGSCDAADGTAPQAPDGQLVVRASEEAEGATEAQEEREQQQLVAALLEECQSAAQAADAAEPAALRAVSAEDFRAARRQATPSVAPDGSVMGDLRAWDRQYGEGGARSGWDAKLSYFM